MPATFHVSHVGIAGNEEADRLAKEAARDQTHGVLVEFRWEASLSNLSRVASENRSRATVQWVAAHVRPEYRHPPPGGSSPQRKQ